MWRREAVAERCTRVGARLQDEETTRHTVLEMATILMLMTDWFESAVKHSSRDLRAEEQQQGPGPTCLREMRASLDAVYRTRDTGAIPHLREHVLAAQRMALAILADLGQGGASRGDRITPGLTDA